MSGELVTKYTWTWPWRLDSAVLSAMVVSMLVLEYFLWRFGASGRLLKWLGISSQEKFTVGEKAPSANRSTSLKVRRLISSTFFAFHEQDLLLIDHIQVVVTT